LKIQTVKRVSAEALFTALFSGDIMNEITMSDIARIAGVSKSTVSRALNNDPRVNEFTKNEIIKIAEKYNYRPNKLAQALAKNTTNIVAVVLPAFPRSIADPFFLKFLQGISEVAIKNGYSLTLPAVNSNDMNAFDKSFANIEMDGVILTEPVFDDPRAKYLQKKNIPFVFNGNPMLNDKIYWVDTDNKEGAYKAVNYLIEKGYNNIATITGSLNLIAGKCRLEGYYKALKDNNIEIKEEFIFEADFTEEGAITAAKEMLPIIDEVDALFAANDLMALGVIKAFREVGISIPDDIALVGYDGIKMGEFIQPSLTTIMNPGIEKGKKAMDLLIKQLKNEKVEKRNILLPPKLLIRESA